MTDFLCDTFSLFCSSGHASDLVHAVPEISPDGLLGAVVLVVGLLAVTGGKR